MNNTPKADRLHIGVFGKVNSGKSSLVNAVTRQNTAVVSDVPGTTTDSVSKSMELPGVGPVVFIDTAGLGDAGKLGALRMEQTARAADRADVALMVFGGVPTETEKEWIEKFRTRRVSVIAVLNKSDIIPDTASVAGEIERETGLRPIAVSAVTGNGIDTLMGAIAEVASSGGRTTITGGLVDEGDVVLLVMPQDAQAPRGRLILPQAQTIRELLDKKCVSVGCTPDKMPEALAALKTPPKLIITDSQVFRTVAEMAPEESMLTSFSVLFARYKGDIGVFAKGAAAIGGLTEESRVLIAEACTHAPQEEDIGRVKIPRMLRSRAGEGLTVDVAGGPDFPADLTPYDLVIHCGACMFNRRHVLTRIARAMEQGVPVTNYGMAIAYLSGILDRVSYPAGD